MVTVGDFSKELCGGVHVKATGEIGLFKIISESSIAAGLRRIEALTGEEALRYSQQAENILNEIQSSLNSPRREIVQQLDKLKTFLKEKERENKSLRQKIASLQFQPQQNKIKEVKGIPVFIQRVEGLNQTELRQLADSLKQKLGSGVVVLGMTSKEKIFLVASVSQDLTARIKADEFIKNIAPIIKGGGGGRPDFAQAGGRNGAGLDKILQKCYSLLEEMIH